MPSTFTGCIFFVFLALVPGVEIESKYYNSPLLLPIATDGQAGCSQLELAQPVVPVLTYQTEMNECQARCNSQTGQNNE